MLQTEVVESQFVHFKFSNVLFSIGPFGDNVGKNCKAGWATDDNIIWCMCFACQIMKARIQTNAHSI